MLAVIKNLPGNLELINMSLSKPMFLHSLFFSSIFSGFSIYFTSNHVFSGGYSPKTSTMALQRYTVPKQYRGVLLELHITQRQLESPGRKNASPVDSHGIKSCVTALPHLRKACLFSTGGEGLKPGTHSHQRRNVVVVLVIVE